MGEKKQQSHAPLRIEIKVMIGYQSDLKPLLMESVDGQKAFFAINSFIVMLS